MGSSPRRVRNFWLRARVDGRRSALVGGPRAKDGGMSLTLYQRRGGSVAAAVEVSCFAGADGTLRLEIEPLLPCTVCACGLSIETRR